MRRNTLIAFALASVGALLVAGEADAAKTLTYGLTSSATLRASVPVQLAAGTQGTTVLGVNATSATTAITLSKNAVDLSTLLGVKSFSAASGATTLRYRSATLLSNVASATLTLGGTTQVVIANGVVTRSSGAPVALAAGGTISASGTNLATTTNAGAATLVFDVLTTPSAATGQSLNETWTITIT